VIPAAPTPARIEDMPDVPLMFDYSLPAWMDTMYHPDPHMIVHADI
jgi:hypothetical protein